MKERIIILLLFCIFFISYCESYQKIDKPINLRKLIHEREISFIDTIEDEPIINPGYQVPSFTASTLNGTYTYTPLPPNQQTPIVIFALQPESAFQTVMWSSNHSLASLFYNSPPQIQYLFLSLSPTYNLDVEYMFNRLQTTMQNLNFTQSQIDQWNENFHFVNDDVTNLQPVYEILQNFPSKIQKVNVFYPSGAKNMRRLDGNWPWDQGMTAVFNRTVKLQIVTVDDPCSPGLDKDIRGKIVLLSVEGNCTINERVVKAELLGAAGVVFYNQKDADFYSLDCDLECEIYPAIPSTLISYENGIEIIDALSYYNSDDILISFEDEVSIGSYFVIGPNSEVEEIGNLMNPSMKFLAWIGEYYEYIQYTVNNVTVAQSSGSFSLPILQSAHMNGPYNVSITIPLSVNEIRSFSSIQLETNLDCNGTRDRSCPIWDRTLQFFVCCGDPNSDLCWQEIGRWITPFHRRVGYWLTPITPLLPLFLNSQQCNFSIAINPQGGGVDDPWVPSLNLLFQYPNQSPISPFKIIPLFNGGTFNQTYNSKYSPIVFTIPEGTVKVELFAVITGHGSDNNGCCEFCVTSHNFMFNNQANDVINKTFYNAGTPEGCAHRVNRGGVPNEYGTWLYGRDGWCDGNTVEPWVTDVSSLLDLSEGAVNNVLYSGLYQGQTPDPQSSPGYIIMYSYLSFYSNLN